MEERALVAALVRGENGSYQHRDISSKESFAPLRMTSLILGLRNFAVSLAPD